MGGPSLVDWIEQGAARTHPDKPVVLGEHGVLRWGELLRGARSLSSFLRDAGLGRGDRIGLWMEKGPACVQALLGILGAGAAYVPLDPLAPPGRAALVARDGGLCALFADDPRRRELPAVLRESGVTLAVVDAPALDSLEEAALARVARVERLADALEFPASEPARPAPDDLAYVLFDTDSSGRPRGVAHTHASGLSLARWVRDRFGIRADDVFAGHTPFHAELSVSDLFASLGAGASLRLLSPAEAGLPPYVAWGLDAWGVSVWSSVPRALVALLDQGGLEARAPARLRLVLFPGELPAPQLHRLRRALPGVTLASLFGHTLSQVVTLRPGDGAAGRPGAG